MATVAGGVISWEAATRSHDLESAAHLCMLAAAVAVLVSAVCLYVRWHVGLEPSMAWLVAATAAFGVQQLNWFLLLMEQHPRPGAQTAWAGAYQVLVTAGLGVLIVNRRRLTLPADPLAVGLGIGIGLIALRMLVMNAAPERDAGYVVSIVGLVAIGLWTARAIARSHSEGPAWGASVALAPMLLAIGPVAVLGADGPAWLMVASIVANTVGGALTIGAAVSSARTAVLDETAALQVLRRRLEVAEMDLHTDQAQLHEVRATLAGITCASELVRRRGISQARREQLQAMTVSELERLQRLVSARSVRAPGPVDLDATLEPVVTRHRTNGLPITWEHRGEVALGRADDVAEIVNILLSNARRHAGRRAVRLTQCTVGPCIEVAVRDLGPGVDPSLRDRLFEWGAAGPGSPGEGVGLATARLLARELGGDLRLDRCEGAGAAFVLSLPTAEQPAVLQSEAS